MSRTSGARSAQRRGHIRRVACGAVLASVAVVGAGCGIPRVSARTPQQVPPFTLDTVASEATIVGYADSPAMMRDVAFGAIQSTARGDSEPAPGRARVAITVDASSAWYYPVVPWVLVIPMVVPACAELWLPSHNVRVDGKVELEIGARRFVGRCHEEGKVVMGWGDEGPPSIAGLIHNCVTRATAASKEVAQ